MNAETTPGFGHFIAGQRCRGQDAAALLLLMSLLSWAIHRPQGLDADRAAQPQPRLPELLLERPLRWTRWRTDRHAHGARIRSSHLASHAMQAQSHPRATARPNWRKPAARAIRHPHHQEGARRGDHAHGERSRGARHRGRHRTLRRPVRQWSGAYHALVAIGMSGAGTLDRVAGPVGEALIVTASASRSRFPVVGLTGHARNRVAVAPGRHHEVHLRRDGPAAGGSDAGVATDAPARSAAA